MLISEKRLVKLINEEVEKAQILKESGAMPPASVLASPMPPAAVLDAETETIDIEGTPEEISQTKKEIRKITSDARFKANVKQSYLFFNDNQKGRITRINRGISQIDKFIEKGPQEYRKMWFEQDMGTGFAGSTSDNDIITSVREGTDLIESSKAMAELFKEFYKKVKIGINDPGSGVEANTIERTARMLANDSRAISNWVYKYPDIVGATPAFMEPGCIGIFACSTGNFPTMGSEWEGGGNTTTPSHRKGSNAPIAVTHNDLFKPKKPRTAASPVGDYGGEPD